MKLSARQQLARGPKLYAANKGFQSCTGRLASKRAIRRVEFGTGFSSAETEAPKGT
jgi:hypothetical protein